MIRTVVNSGAFVKTAVRSHIRFHADNGFKTGFFRFLIKFNGSVKVAVVGQSQGLHTQFFGVVN